MDFQAIVDSMAAMTCVVSVEKRPDGSCGDVRLVTGNKSYIESIEHPAQDLAMLTQKFVPNSLYTDYMTRDLNFEDFCYRAAVQKKCLHSYAHPDRYDVWFNMTFLPLVPDDGNICYCTYTMEINFEPNSERISDIDGDIAAAVLETAITLRSAKDFRAAMKDAVEEVRKLCDAENSCILGMDYENETCEVLGESFKKDSPLVRLHKNDAEFYKIAKTWKDTIMGSNCIIAKDDRDMEVVAERNPVWHKSLVEAGVRTVALFPLRSRNEYLGYIWATNFDPDRAARIKEILELATFVLGSEIANYLMVNQLKVLSSQDMLTGVMNRNEMNIRVAELSGGAADAGAGGDVATAASSATDATDQNPAADGRPSTAANNSVGVIFTDLNGLKRTNDSKGHHAGDVLLKEAAAVFKELFDQSEIFRAGGDEFVVLLTGITEEELEASAEKLKKAAAEEGVSFSIGWSYENDARNVHRALADADQKMYDDKMQFYARRK